MYTIVKNAKILLALLKYHNIRHIVISPGTTNMPIIRGVQNDPFFTCYSVVDERSAMYFAIGLYLDKGEPVATSCTSAQATRNYIPGLTEAFYKHIPILAITTSKHPRFVHQEYMQAPNQISLPEDAVKKTYALPYISNQHDELYCERLVNEAILELTHRTPGPIQINLPILEDEVRKYTDSSLPSVKPIKRYMEWDDWNVSLVGKKIMIVIGEHRPFSQKQINILEAFMESHNSFAYINHLSNYHGKYVVSANLAMASISYDIFSESYQPDILITIGGQTGDYPLHGKLSSGSRFAFEHWRVSEDGNIVDIYDKLTKVFECPFELFFTRLAENKDAEHPYYEQWKELQRTMLIPENLPLSNAYLAGKLHNLLPKNSYLNLAILNSLRVWNYFPLDPSITCYSNVAAFGIDGCMSVLLGESVATDKLCFLVIGDLAFFYDMNSLGIRHLKNNIRILLVNNGCGIEFKLYSHPAYPFGSESDIHIAAAGHNSDAKGWAEANGFKYITASSKEDFLNLREEFISEGGQSIVFEIFTKPEDESDAIKAILTNNRQESGLKAIVRKTIGEKGVEVLKNILKK
jgi:2-succinyl-5-enolpyruvyl-6-hydroxy-3-cyclohexene-1-carboxylate synthase